MGITRAARTIVQSRDIDPMYAFYQDRDESKPRTHVKLVDPPSQGLSFFYDGKILPICEHFSIEFQSQRGKRSEYDILLHVGARLPQNYIVRNSCMAGRWGPAECASNLQFQLKRGMDFWMQVLLTDKKFYISVNGFHVATYKHRMPFRWLHAVEICGDIADVRCEMYYVTEYPNRLPATLPKPVPFIYKTHGSLLHMTHGMPEEWLHIDTPSKFLQMKMVTIKHLALPFYGRLPLIHRLTNGRTLRIEGRVRIMPQSFSVALQHGQDVWPQPPVAFYLSVNFLHHVRSQLGKMLIVRSAFIKGKWVKREESSVKTHLRPGQAFVVLIVCRYNCYDLYVNQKFLLDFKFQMNPALVDIVNIRGDIKLWDVGIEASIALNIRTTRSIFGRAFDSIRPRASEY